MATPGDGGVIGKLERARDERETLLSRSTESYSSKRRAGSEICFLSISLLSGIAFIVLGSVTLVLGILISRLYTGAYVVGGAAEFVLGVYLLIRQVLKCIKCPAVSTSQRSIRNATSCVHFISLALLFLVWCTTACSLFTAIILSGLNYEGDKREMATLVLACVSLLFELVFGVSVCCWAGCAVD